MTTKSEDKGDKELSPIESKLLDYTKKGLPVLLHGRDDYGREDLIKSD
ncbi:MAG: hypothetical protein GY775_07640 [Candidatus Scalindua sp.]|nr:hypothetical protein [Candidatus Scalindua sp.]